MKTKKCLALLLVLAALLLAACGTPGGTSGASISAANSNNGSDVQTVKNTEVVMTVTAEIITLDPQVNAGGTSANTVRQNMFEALVRIDTDGEIQPCLATEWDVDESNTVWTFHLREGVKFHDGESMTAADVKATFDRFKTNEGSTRAYYYKNILEVNVIDNYTVEFVTETPQSNFLHILAYDGSYIMSVKSLERSNEEIASQPVGTGPYKFQSSEGTESVTLERFEEYWGEKPDITKLKFIAVTEVATRVNMLRAGEADLITGITDEDLAYFLTDENFAVMYGNSNRVGHLAINSSRPGLNDLRVRQAIEYAIDKEALVQGILGDRGEVAHSVIAPLTYGYYDSGLYGYNPEKAKELLAQAGYQEGELSFVIQSPDGRYYKDKECCMAIANMLQNVGINATVEVNDWASFVAKVKVAQPENKVDMWWMGWESGTGEASQILNVVFIRDNFPPTGWNAMFFDNEEYEGLKNQVLSEMDEKKQLEMYAEMQKLIMEDAVWVPVTVYHELVVYRADLSGIEITYTDVVRFTGTKVG